MKYYSETIQNCCYDAQSSYCWRRLMNQNAIKLYLNLTKSNRLNILFLSLPAIKIKICITRELIVYCQFSFQNSRTVMIFNGGIIWLPSCKTEKQKLFFKRLIWVTLYLVWICNVVELPFLDKTFFFGEFSQGFTIMDIG